MDDIDFRDIGQRIGECIDKNSHDLTAQISQPERTYARAHQLAILVGVVLLRTSIFIVRSRTDTSAA